VTGAAAVRAASAQGHAKLLISIGLASFMRLLLALLFASVLLPGCGLKGPLYIPTADETRELEERRKLLEERRQRENEEQRKQATQPAQQ
jgi:predicted small lipoprotein YifL